MTHEYEIACPECEGTAVVMETSGAVMCRCDNCEFLDQQSMRR